MLAANRWVCHIGSQSLVIGIMGRAIRTNNFAFSAHIQIDMRVIIRGSGTNAFKSLRAYLYGFNTGVIMKFWNGCCGHITPI